GNHSGGEGKIARAGLYGRFFFVSFSRNWEDGQENRRESSTGQKMDQGDGQSVDVPARATGRIGRYRHKKAPARQHKQNYPRGLDQGVCPSILAGDSRHAFGGRNQEHPRVRSKSAHENGPNGSRGAV